MPYKSFETERLHLRPTNLEDVDLILTLVNTPKWLKYIGDRNVKTESQAIRYINEKMLPQLERLGYGNYTLIRKSDKAKLGTCGLYDREGLEGIDIGFALLPEYERIGFAYEAALTIRDAASQEFGCTQLRAITTQDNYLSQKLIDKLGFTYSKLIRIPNDPVELMLYEYQSK